jgi:KUP system potassium uptake protein
MGLPGRKRQVQFEIPHKGSGISADISVDMGTDMRKELRDLLEAKEAGIAYVMGHAYVKAKKSSSLLKKFIINFAYTFLRRNCRDPAIALCIPHISLLEVGMICYI